MSSTPILRSPIVADASLPSGPSSLWAATAPAAPATPALDASLKTDVLVIGGGFTGLSTAVHLAEAGTQVCVLEAHEPGWGASGRNGGQVNPTLKHDPDELVRLFGRDFAEPLIDTVSRSADLVFDLIRRYAIDCHPVRSGWLQLCYSPNLLGAMHARAAQWEKRGVPVERLDRSAVAARAGTQAFCGGWVDGRAGGLQPLAYSRGLARAALDLGVRIHGDTRVRSLQRDAHGWVATTERGVNVRAEKVVIATNGYTDGLWPKLEETVLAANSFIVATKPLPAQAVQRILSRGETASTSQRLLLYFRLDHTGRLLMGGRGFFRDPTGPQDFAHLERSLALLFPDLGPVEYDYRWSGRIAITRDFMPHIHEPAPGLIAALGCNGRGVALCTSLGQHIAARLSTAQARFPYPVSGIQPIPFHGMQRFYIAAGVAWYSLLDRLGVG